MKFGDKVGHAYTSLYSEQGSGGPQEAISLSSVYYDVTQLKSVHASSSLRVIYVCYQEIEYSYIILMNLFLCNYKYITMIAGLFI